MPRINTRDAADFIAETRPFSSNGAISGWITTDAYVVKSYSTAIAVIRVEDNSAVLNTAQYSATTSRHQAAARRGLALGGYTVTEESDPVAFETLTGYRARLRGANGWN